jgi:capsid protein
MEPGIIERLLPGEDVKFTAPSGSGDFNGLARHHLRAIAQAFGLTYDLLTGDLTEANYSSLRAGRLAFRRRLEADQWLLLVPQLVRPIWDAFAAAAMRAGLLKLRTDGYPAEFGPPAFEMVDPLKDAEGIRLMRRMGLMTRAQAIAEQGWDPRRQIEELAAENALADRLGLILDDDPRRIAGTGAAQDAAQNAAVQLRSGQGETA